MSEKRPKNGQKWPECALFVSNTPKTKNGPYLGLRGSKPNSEGTYSTRNAPLFVVSKPQNRLTSHLDPCTSAHLVAPARPAHGGGQRWVHRGPQGKKNIFSKVVPRPLGMLKQVFLGCFEPVVARFGPWKIPKCLENGPFQDQKWVKNGSKTHFFKSDLGPFWMLKQVFLGRFEPAATHFGPWKICAVFGPKQPFLAQNSPETQPKRPNEGKRWLHYTCTSIAP